MQQKQAHLANAQDPVNDGSAVLVTRYNITQHKELEHELVIRQSSLEQ